MNNTGYLSRQQRKEEVLSDGLSRSGKSRSSVKRVVSNQKGYQVVRDEKGFKRKIEYHDDTFDDEDTHPPSIVNPKRVKQEDDDDLVYSKSNLAMSSKLRIKQRLVDSISRSQT
jgi:hypothetical protein